MSGSSNSEGISPWGLFALAVAVRAAHLLTVSAAPFFDYLYIDPALYDSWGHAIARGRWFSDAPFFLDPLYPYFVGAVYAFAGRSPFAVAVVQSVLGALVAPLVFSAARPWLGRTVALVAGLFAALYPPSIYWGGALMKPALASFVVALALWLLSRGLSGARRFAWCGAGAALSCAVLLRGTLLPALPLVVLWLWVHMRRRVAAAWLAGGMLAVLALPLAHNLAVAGEPILTTTNWGQIFYIGNNPLNASGRFEELPWVRSNPAFEQIDFKSEAERRAGRPLSHGAVSRFWLREGLAWVAAEPRDWAHVLFSKLRLYWGAYETPASLDYYFYSRHAPVLRLPLPGFGLLGPLALLGAYFAWKQPGWPRLLVVWIAAASAVTVLCFVLTRFRMVIVPALFVLAALGAVELVGRVRRAVRGEARVRAVVACAALVAAWAFVNLPVRAPADSRGLRVAAALGLPVRVETTANARFNLGVTYARHASAADDARPLLRRAEAELRAAVAEEEQSKYLIELGKVLARDGREREALEVYGRVAQRDPRDYRAPHAQGLLYKRLGEHEAAAAAFLAALQAEPRSAASAIELGQLLLDSGQPARAADSFRHALQVRPDSEPARRGLAAAEAESQSR